MTFLWQWHCSPPHFPRLELRYKQQSLIPGVSYQCYSTWSLMTPSVPGTGEVVDFKRSTAAIELNIFLAPPEVGLK